MKDHSMKVGHEIEISNLKIMKKCPMNCFQSNFCEKAVATFCTIVLRRNESTGMTRD